jgi:hypothetical protein
MAETRLQRIALSGKNHFAFAESDHPAHSVNLRRISRGRMLPYASVVGLRGGTGCGVLARRLSRRQLGRRLVCGFVVTEASGHQDH